MACLVVCGRVDVIATFAPTSALVSVDLPVFGRPTKHTKTRMEFGHAGFLAEREHRETFPAFFRRECTFGVIAGYLPDR